MSRGLYIMICPVARASRRSPGTGSVTVHGGAAALPKDAGGGRPCRPLPAHGAPSVPQVPGEPHGDGEAGGLQPVDLKPEPSCQWRSGGWDAPHRKGGSSALFARGDGRNPIAAVAAAGAAALAAGLRLRLFRK
jgi:hypothetical protein